MIFNHDDAPLYLLQRNLHKNEEMKRLLEDYTIPKYFKENYQQLMDKKSRSRSESRHSDKLHKNYGQNLIDKNISKINLHKYLNKLIP